MDQLIIDAIATGGYLGIFLLMALENVVPPVPSELIMGIGGLLVQRGEMQFWPLLLIGTAGTVLGNWFWFWLGDRWGRWLTLEWEDIARAQAFFVRRGHWVVFALRFSPFLRTMISLPAGLAHMPRWRFLAFTFAGSMVWNAALIMGGQWLGRYFAQSQDVIGWIVIGSLVLALGAYFWRVVRWTPRSERAVDQDRSRG